MPQLNISTVVGCSVACTYCPQGMFIKQAKKRPTYSQVMSFETFAACLETIPKDVVLPFSGFSEPFNNPEALRMIRHAVEQGYEPMVYTTLVGATVEVIDELLALNAEVPFFLHLPSDKQTEKITVDDAYKTMLSNIIGGPQPYELHVNVPDLHPDLVPVLERHKVNERVLHDRGGNLDRDDLNDLREQVWQRPHRGKIECGAIVNNMLLPNGDVAICCNDWKLEHIIGNLLEDSYEDLFRSAEYLRFVEAMKHDDSDTLCRRCSKWAMRRDWTMDPIRSWQAPPRPADRALRLSLQPLDHALSLKTDDLSLVAAIGRGLDASMVRWLLPGAAAAEKAAEHPDLPRAVTQEVAATVLRMIGDYNPTCVVQMGADITAALVALALAARRAGGEDVRILVVDDRAERLQALRDILADVAGGDVLLTLQTTVDQIRLDASLWATTFNVVEEDLHDALAGVSPDMVLVAPGPEELVRGTLPLLCQYVHPHALFAALGGPEIVRAAAAWRDLGMVKNVGYLTAGCTMVAGVLHEERRAEPVEQQAIETV